MLAKLLKAYSMSEQSILMMMTTIVLLSGGVDSTACAHYMLKRNHRVTPLFVDYGQRAAIPEHRAASGICDALGLTLQCVKSITGRSFGVGEITGRNAFLIMAATMS